MAGNRAFPGEIKTTVTVAPLQAEDLFQEEQRFAVGSQPRAVVVADLNGDGLPDLVTANVASDDISVLLHHHH